MFVKICGTTTEEDALLAVALGADAVGFVFAPSPRQIAFGKARDIAVRLPHDVLTVGVFRNELPERVVEIASRASLKAVQLHGSETAEQTTWVAKRVNTVIKAFPAGHPGLDRVQDYNADIVLMDSARPGSGVMFDWSLAEGAPVAGHRLMLAGGLDADNVAGAVRQVKPWGVDASTGLESSPGRKDPAKMLAFIEAAKEAYTALESSRRTSASGHGDAGAPYDWADL